MSSVFPLVLQWTNQQKTVPDWQAVCWPSWLGGGATQQAWWGFEVVYVEPGSGWPWAVDRWEGGCGWLTWTWPGLWSCHGELFQDFLLAHIHVIYVHFSWMGLLVGPSPLMVQASFFYSGAMLFGSCCPPRTHLCSSLESFARVRTERWWSEHHVGRTPRLHAEYSALPPLYSIVPKVRRFFFFFSKI